MKVEAAKARLSPALGLGRRDRRSVCKAKDGCPCASSHSDPLADGRGIERVQWRRLRFVGAIAGFLAQQPPTHQ